MKKIFLVGILALFFFSNLLAQKKAAKSGVTFYEGTWNELLAKAKEEKKPFWVDIYTTWCGPCKMMAKQTFADEEVGKFTSENYISYKLDAENGEGVNISEKYGVEAYPTFLIFNAEGKLLAKEEGFKDAERFIYVLEKYKEKKKKKK
ncbi:MAG: thioredoxin family protein [Bacteroidetes bacterium]|nr:MAG: thioredoxin family protein [Bacteroidota bacterium]TAG95496.1 MAG: thioredoxin family protein [Bacteroidota bacterium]